MEKIKTAVLVSGGGTNLQAILDAEREGIIKSAEVVTVISDREGAYALERARAAGAEALTIPFKTYGREAFERELSAALEERGIGLIVLAGFMRILSAEFTAKYSDRILNIHPSLIPSFCGAGYYGLKVHEAALNYGVKVTGATVHFVNEIPDGGKIVAQKAVYIRPEDTPESLQKRVMQEAEWIIFPRAIEEVAAKLRRSE